MSTDIIAQGLAIKVKPETFGTKTRRLARQAEVSNPIINPPWKAAPAWAGSTAYTQGAVVSANGYLWVCASSGTSAASGGPTYNASNPSYQVTDGAGALAWTVYGTAQITSDDALAPSITTSSSISGLAQVVSSETYRSNFKFWGCYPQTYLTFYTLLRSYDSKSGTSVSGWSSFEFETDAPKFAIRLASSPPIAIIIDGRYYSPALLATNGATPNYVIVDFTTTGGKKRRSVKVEYFVNSLNGFTCGGVYTTTVDTVWAPNTLDSIRAVAISDSIWAGSGYGPFLAGRNTSGRLGKLLGWKDVWDFSIGGTGWCNPGGGPNYTYGQRIPEALTLNPDLWLFMGSTNDVTYTSAQVTAAALATFQSIRAGGSKAPIIVLGVWSVADGRVAVVEAAVKAAVTQFGDANTYFIPIWGDPTGSWIGNGANNVRNWVASTAYTATQVRMANGNAYICTTSGTSASSGTGPSGTGSAIPDGTNTVWSYVGPDPGWAANSNYQNGLSYVSVDGIHPPDAGTAYLADRAARAIKSQVLPYLV